MTVCRTVPSSITPERNMARRSLRILWSPTRSSTKDLNRSCGSRKSNWRFRLNHPPLTLKDASSKTCRASAPTVSGLGGRVVVLRAEPETARPEIGLENRLNNGLRRRLHTAARTAGIDNGRLSELAGLRNPHPPGLKPPIPFFRKFRLQFVEQAGNPVTLDGSQGDMVDAASAAIWG